MGPSYKNHKEVITIFEVMIHRTNYFGGSSPSIQSSAEKAHTTHSYGVEIADSSDKIMIITA